MTDVGHKIRIVISGFIGSITAGFCVAFGVSFLTANTWTVTMSGLLVGLASSLVNAFSPLISQQITKSGNPYVFLQWLFSLLGTFLLVFLPLVPYAIIDDMRIARITSVATGLVMIFIFGIHQSEVARLEKPVQHAFGIMVLGGFLAFICFLLAKYFLLVVG